MTQIPTSIHLQDVNEHQPDMITVSRKAIPCICPAGDIDSLGTSIDGRTDIIIVGTRRLELEQVREYSNIHNSEWRTIFVAIGMQPRKSIDAVIGCFHLESFQSA